MSKNVYTVGCDQIYFFGQYEKRPGVSKDFGTTTQSLEAVQENEPKQIVHKQMSHVYNLTLYQSNEQDAYTVGVFFSIGESLFAKLGFSC